MAFSHRLNTLGLGSFRAPMRCPRRLWGRLLRDLRSRGLGVKESGAFLLGTHDGGIRRVRDYMLYDDVDPESLVGMIDLDGSRMDLVWAECARSGLSVVADVHTHPFGYNQSAIDRENPMMPRRGHVALIVPNFAARAVGPDDIGIYELVDRGRWRDRSRDGRAFFSLEWF